MKKIVLISLLIFLAAAVFAGCSFSFSTANIKDAVMTTDVDENGKPLDTVTEYAPDAEKFVVSAQLNNTPDNTKIRFVWNYLTDKIILKEIPIDSQNKSGVYVSCNLTFDKQWPTGDYNVEIYVDERDKPDATVTFAVK